MKVTVFGSGYVGLVTGALLADVGNDVLCVDVDQAKIDLLKSGEIPIYEPGLDQIVQSAVAQGRLNFTTDVIEAVGHAELQFIAVGTPPDEDGSADLQYVKAVAKTIGKAMDSSRIVINKSTVPVGTADLVKDCIQAELDERGLELDFDVVSNPEFLKEGAAVSDFRRPDRVIVGASSEHAIAQLRELYGPFCRNHDRLVVMDVRSAELAKYAANAMLATKISFMNELSNVADRLGADIEQVRLGIGSDSRIGFDFIYPGCGYGGSCFPKDVKALVATARQYGYEPELLASVEAVNQRQKHVLLDKITRRFGENLEGRTFAFWGLSFKPNTDDMRDAPSRVLLEALWARGAKVKAYDPVAMKEVRRIYPDKRAQLELMGTAGDTLFGADALVINTEWREFRSPDWPSVKESLSEPVVFDGRNMYDPDILSGYGIAYECIGRPPLSVEEQPDVLEVVAGQLS